jgi:hypothetical protein
MASSAALSNDSILQRVLSFVGPGEWAFCSTVSKLWAEMYRLVPTQHWPEADTCIRAPAIDVVPQTTLHRAVFASAARLKLAYDLGLQWQNNERAGMQNSIGRVASVEALDAAHTLGMPLSNNLVLGAYSANLAAAIWLRTQHQCVSPAEITSDVNAATYGNVELLQWHKQQGVVFSEMTMVSAAVQNQLHVCQYLHAEGCPSGHAASVSISRGFWRIARWMISAGFTWAPFHACLEAARTADVDTMNFLVAVSPEAETICKVKFISCRMLNAAGAHGNLAVAKWLRSRGAEWPHVLQDKVQDGMTSWSGDTLEWARAEECDSPLTI